MTLAAPNERANLPTAPKTCFGDWLMQTAGFSSRQMAAIEALRDADNPHDEAVGQQLLNAGFSVGQRETLVDIACSAKEHDCRAA